MVLLEQLINHPENVNLLIVPTVLIPLTLVSVGISVIATFIAGLFGITLKTEGPKRLLELLLKPKIIFSALLLNTLFLGGWWGYQYIQNMPAFIFTINQKNAHLAKKPSKLVYSDRPEKKNYASYVNKKPSKLNLKLIQTTKVPGGVFRWGVLGKKTLFFGTSEGKTYEVSQSDLSIIREIFVGTFVSPSPIIWNNLLIHGEGLHDTHHARIYAFDLTTGQLSQTFRTKGHTEGTPVIADLNGDAYLVFPAGSDGLYAVNPQNMELRWHNNDGHTDSEVRIDERSVFVGTGRDKGDSSKYRSYALSYDLVTGKTNWKRELPASSWMKPAIINENVCFIYGEVYFKSDFGGIDCFHKKTGRPTQTYRSMSPIVSIPLSVGDDLFYANNAGEVCRIDTKQKQLRWCADTKGDGKNSFASVAYDPFRNLLIYPSRNKGLFVFSPKSGELIKHWKPSEKEEKWHTTYAGVMVTENFWFLADMKGHIRKLDPVGLPFQ